MSLFALAALLATGIAALTDWRSGHIPNGLTIGAFALGIGGHAALALAEGDVAAAGSATAAAMLGAALSGLVPLLLWRIGALGGGDVKLFIALGALLGPLLGLEAELNAFACSAIIFPIQLLFRGQLRAMLRRSIGVLVHAVRPKQPLDTSQMTWFRLGPAIFGGTLLAILSRSS